MEIPDFIKLLFLFFKSWKYDVLLVSLFYLRKQVLFLFNAFLRFLPILLCLFPFLLSFSDCFINLIKFCLVLYFQSLSFIFLDLFHFLVHLLDLFQFFFSLRFELSFKILLHLSPFLDLRLSSFFFLLDFLFRFMHSFFKIGSSYILAGHQAQVFGNRTFRLIKI